MDFEVQFGTLTEYRGEDEYVTIPTQAVGSSSSECGFVRLRDSRVISAIGDIAFMDNKKLKGIIIPDQVIRIGKMAFYECENLEKIVIPDSVERIGDRAFSYCTSLTEVVLGRGVKSIGREAFLGCENLRSVTVPESVTEIGERALGYLRALTLLPRESFVICGKKGSAAESYAHSNHFVFKAL